MSTPKRPYPPVFRTPQWAWGEPTDFSPGLSLLESVGDPASRQIVWRHLYANAVAYQNTYAVLAHFAGNGCQHDVSTIVQLDFEKCIGLFVDYRALCWN